MTFVIIVFVMLVLASLTLLSYHLVMKELYKMHDRTIEAQERRTQVYKDYVILLRIYKAVLEELIKDDYDISELPIPWKMEKTQTK